MQVALPAWGDPHSERRGAGRLGARPALHPHLLAPLPLVIFQ